MNSLISLTCPSLSAIEGKHFLEPCPIDRLDALLNSKLLEDWDKKKLPKYRALFKSEFNGMIVKYCRGEFQPFGIGRVNPKDNIGAHFISRKIRHTLFNGIYTDIDMKNCQVSILYQLLDYFKREKGENVKYDILKSYCDNRDVFLKSIMETYNINKDDAKTLIIIIMNGGSYSNWRFKNKKDIIINQIEELEKEFKQAITIIEKYNPKYIQHIKGFNKFSKGSIIAFYLQTIEDLILSECFNYLVENKVIPVLKNNKDKNIYKTTPSNDGIMVPIENYNDELLTELNELIKSKFELDMTFINKKMDEGYSMEYIMSNQKTKDEIIEELHFIIDWKTSDQEYYADLFYSNNKEEYIYKNKKTGWFYYNEYNILVNTSEPPIGLNNKITSFCQSYIMELFRKLDPSYEKFGAVAKGIQKISQKLGGTQFCDGIIKKLEDKYHNDDILNLIDSNPLLLCFKNKLFDFSIWAFRPIEKNDFCMNHTGYNAPEYVDDEVQKEISECIKSIFDDGKEQDFFMRSVGLSLLTNKFERLNIWTGKGANGKGTLATLITKAFGNFYYQANTQFITSVPRNGADPDLFNCRGKKLVMISEPEKTEGQTDVKFNIERIKSLTGRDTLTCRALYKDPISYIPQFTLFLQTNDIPDLNKLDGGIKRRMVIWPFRNSFVDEPNPENPNEKKKDNNLKERLETERFYSQFMRMLIDYIENLSEDDRNNLPVPKSFINETNEYFDNNNPLLEFIKSELVPSDKHTEKLTDILYTYKDRDYPKISEKMFYSLIKQNNLTTKRTTKLGLCLVGYKIKEIQLISTPSKIDKIEEIENTIV